MLQYDTVYIHYPVHLLGQTVVTIMCYYHAVSLSIEIMFVSLFAEL